MMRPIHRSLADPALDDVDHALGRPRNPLAPTYRNHFAVDPDTELAAAMDASPWWLRVPLPHGGGMACYVVTHEGCKALAEYLRKGA